MRVFVDAEYGDEGMENKEFEEMNNGDETSYGLTSARSAEIRALKEGWGPLIDKLYDQGVRFGYDGNGPGYCGVSFIQLIILDTSGKKVYKVYLSNSGEC